MKICYLGNAQIIHLQRWVSSFAQRGHEVHVITGETAEIKGAFVHNISLSATSVFQGVPIVARLFHLLRKHSELKKLRILIEKIDPDVIHAHYLTNYGILGARIGFHPFIITAWGSDILVAPKKFGEKHVFLMKHALEKADMISTDGNNTKEEIIRMMGNPKKFPKKIEIVLHGVDTVRFSAERRDEDLRKELSLSSSPMIISLRNLEPIYDVETLIKAIPLVLTWVPDAKFVIGGAGSQEACLKELAESLGVSDSLRFVGWIPHDKLPRYLASADIYVSTSLSDGGISVSTLEAMACELAPIVTDVGDNTKWINNGENGFIVAPSDPDELAKKITYLLERETIRKEFGKKSRRIVKEKAEYENEMGRMENLYKELTGGTFAKKWVVQRRNLRKTFNNYLQYSPNTYSTLRSPKCFINLICSTV